MKRIGAISQNACAYLSARLCCLREEGQGTTEYAILVGVLAVIAMIAIVAFKDKVSELWNAIKDGINGL
ncbi:MAG: Flp family type IVb pilin [Coriobacteriales bacterium]